MTSSTNKKFMADLSDWVDLCEDGMGLVAKEASQRMMDNIEIGPSITRVGYRQHGTIPRDLGALAMSLQTTLAGSSFGTFDGEDAYSFGITQMALGDSIYFTWGGASAGYALEVHYGANGVPGTHWVDVAASRWQGYVKQVANEVKAMLRS